MVVMLSTHQRQRITSPKQRQRVRGTATPENENRSLQPILGNLKQGNSLACEIPLSKKIAKYELFNLGACLVLLDFPEYK